MKRAFLFDMDGTLVDSLADIGGSMNHVLETLGLPVHPIEAYRLMVGEGARSLIEKALPPGREALRDEALARYRARYATHMIAASRPYDGVVALLEALRARGDALAVVTNKPHAAAVAIADSLFGDRTFAIVVGEREGLAKKPDAAPALLAAREIGVAPGACVFVGDTAIDIHTARAAGMTSVGVLWGFRDRAELEGARADHVVARPAEILGL
jgi:phosphoglycolate phosphatase